MIPNFYNISPTLYNFLCNDKINIGIVSFICDLFVCARPICSIQQSAVPNEVIILTQLVYLVPFSLHKKIKSSINNFFSKYDQIRLVTFPEEILNRKFHLSCSFSSMRVLILMPATIQTPVL